MIVVSKMVQRDKQIGSLNQNVNFKKQAPFPRGVLADILTDRGFSIQEESGAELVASRDDLLWIYNANEGALNVKVNEIGSLEEADSEIQEILFEEINVEHSECVGAEISIDILVWNGESTVDTFDNIYDAPEFGGHFDQDTTPITVRFVSDQDYDPSDPEIYDIKVESYLQNNNYYYVDMTYRKPEFESLEPMISNLDAEIDNIIDKIEDFGD